MNDQEPDGGDEYGRFTGHDYDGIREYDNPLPAWWSWMFVGSIFYAVGYWAFYHNGIEGRSVYAAYDRAVADNLKTQFAEIGELDAGRETILRFADDPKWVKVGEVTYLANCVSCHGQDAGGLVGPNLTDDYWKHVKKAEDIATVLRDGANNGAMPGWQHRLHKNEIVLLSSYLVSLRGSVPAERGKRLAGETLVADWHLP
ncbi:MAG: cbb3-type cytochrome c oxidase N-terminal domain-containing protein [Planctomycetota bacterium]